MPTHPPKNQRDSNNCVEKWESLLWQVIQCFVLMSISLSNLLCVASQSCAKKARKRDKKKSDLTFSEPRPTMCCTSYLTSVILIYVTLATHRCGLCLLHWEGKWRVQHLQENHMLSEKHHLPGPYRRFWRSWLGFSSQIIWLEIPISRHVTWLWLSPRLEDQEGSLGLPSQGYPPAVSWGFRFTVRNGYRLISPPFNPRCSRMI